MPVIDERGRLFGRINVIDATVGGLVVALIPIAFGAYVLFRQPEPRLISVEPTTITPTTTHLKVVGENLRPFLRVSIGQVQGTTFALLNPTTAEVQLPSLSSGTYDIVLYDVSREVHRLSNAVTVEAAAPQSSQAKVMIAGSVVAVDQPAANEIQKGVQLTATGGNRFQIAEMAGARPDTRTVQSGDVFLEMPLGSGTQVPVLLRGTCTIVDRRCQVGGIDMEPGFALQLFLPSGRVVRFIIDEALPDGATHESELEVRLIMPTESSGLVRAGDRDRGHLLLTSRVASLVAVTSSRRVTAQNLWQQSVPWSGAGDWSLAIQDAAMAIDARIRVTLDVTSSGLRYRGRSIRAGAPFLWQTERYTSRGWVLTVSDVPGNRGQ
ncbi:MAG: DUF4330 family protein [Acidobacteriota bacterium]